MDCPSYRHPHSWLVAGLVGLLVSMVAGACAGPSTPESVRESPSSTPSAIGSPVRLTTKPDATAAAAEPTATPGVLPTAMLEPTATPGLFPSATLEATATLMPVPTSTPDSRPTPQLMRQSTPTVTRVPTPTPRPAYTRTYGDITSQDDVLVGAHYYPWYSLDRHWDEGRTDTPALGDYDSRDLNVINRHIDEATGHGIDFFNVSWWGPGTWEDDTLRTTLLEAELIDDIAFTVFYETVGRLKRSGDGTISLDSPANRARLIADFKYLAENYFDHPSYLRIDDKPVVAIYLTRILTGDVAGAVTDLRSEVRALGFELFILADEVYWQSPVDPEQIARMRNYDAVFSYNMHYSNSDVSIRFVERSLAQYRMWKAVADDIGVAFVPGVMPGFDASELIVPNPYVIERSPEEFAQFLEGSLDLLGEDLLMLVTSYNEWHEGTQLESSVEGGTDLLATLAMALSEPER